MKTRLTVLIAVLAAALVLGSGCATTSQGATKTIEVSMDDVLRQSAITRDVTLSVGDTLKVMLGANRSTPYRWTADPKIGDSAILKQTGHEYLRQHTDRVGAPGNEVWTFTALKAGKTTIVAGYASVVGGDTSPTCTFTANVTVQ
ncbi:protease inhibitor I42 family protein [Mycobacterium shinjukuense]|uniref:Uncharacterized protein n=1 Tax=Mycobacterium shinjukuense TaxID=398694 RepID=A0A7I7MLD7_9MYCO|nr:protease inhibitor I42 family protein [Mycobacterium shinjukuense]MCV6984359.1 protease inhibitor I42 family protein [Mycobacterium shinjukuense]ORB70970.1 hypothetical protein BST45_04435 [Mycobacterium shinjukuense]BBX73081.1 hypothetical protein MSHI_09870 [Mycobacterium shinjukuense]